MKKLMHVHWVAAVLFASTGFCPAAEPTAPPGDLSHTIAEEIPMFLSQLVIIFVALRVVIKLCKKLQVEDFILEIGVGVLIGPTVLGRFAPGIQTYLFPDTTVQKALFALWGTLGIVFWLFQGGTEVKPREAVKHGKAAAWLGIGGVVLPFVAGSLLSLLYCKLTGYSAPGGQSIHLVAVFLGNTMAISAMVIVVRLFTALKIIRSEIGQMILCGYAINDVVAWLTYGVIFQLASGGGKGPFQTIVLLIIGMGLTGFCLRYAPAIVNRQLEGIAMSKGRGTVYVFVLSLMLGLGFLTEKLGLTMYFGVFLAGVVVSASNVVTHEVKERLTTIGRYAMAPVFFVGLGMSCDFVRHFSPMKVAFITVSSLVLKYLGAVVCAYFAGRPKKEWHLIGVSFIPGDVNGIVLGGLAMSYGLITQDFLNAIIASAVISSIVAAPALRRAISSVNQERPDKSLLDSIPVIWRNLPRCDEATRELALEKHIIPKIASHTDQPASEIRKKIEFMREKFAMEIRSEVFDFPHKIAHVHIPLPVDDEMLLVFWAGKDIEWGTEGVRVVIVSVTPDDQSVSSLSDRVATLMFRLDQKGLLALDGTVESYLQFRAELQKLLV